MEAILEPLVKSPKFLQYVDELNAYLKAEQIKRLAFREWLDEDKKAEFINGEVVMHSPTRLGHNETRQRISNAARLYALRRAIGKVIDEKATISLRRNDYMPDVCFWRSEVAEPISPDQQLMPIPDFVCEVLSQTTERLDRGQKFTDYAEAGIREYWIVDYDRQIVEQYVLEDGAYRMLAAHRTGTIESVAITGFSIAVDALFDDEANVDAIERINALPRVVASAKRP